jgi:YD repeat-containing protein
MPLHATAAAAVVKAVGVKAHPMTTSTATPGPATTGVNRWWDYEEGTIPGVGTYMANVGTGNLIIQATDMDVPERGLDLAFRRTYNSQSLHDAENDDGSVQSSFGDGWTSTFDAHLGASGGTTNGVANVVSVYDIDGARYDYTLSDVGSGGNASYTPPAGMQGTTLNFDGSCGMYWTKKTGTQYAFYAPWVTACNKTTDTGSFGRLIDIFGRNSNNWIHLAYSWVNNNDSTSDNLSEIQVNHSDGQSVLLNFEYFSGSPHPELQKLTRPDGSVITYTYDATVGTHLVGVTLPGHSLVAGGAVVAIQSQYQYRSNWLPEYVCSPRYIVAQNASLNDGGCTLFSFASTDINGVTNNDVTGAWDWVWANFAPSDGTNTALQPGLNSGYYYVDNRTFSYESYPSSNSTWQTTMTDTDGHTTRYFVDAEGRLNQTDAWVGSSFTNWLITYETWDRNNDRVSSVDARDYETDYAYDANGNTIAVALPAVTTSAGAIRPTSTYTYDVYNNLLSFCDAVYNTSNSWYNPSNPPPACPTSGIGAGYTVYNWNEGDTNETYGYLTDTYTPLGYHRSIAYSQAIQGGDFGLPTSVAGASYTQDDGTVRTPSQAFTYDSNGNLATYNKGNGVWSLVYDSLNRMIVVTDPDNVTAYRCYYPDSSLQYTESAAQHAADGTPSGCLATSPSAAVAYTYDADGDLLTETRHYDCASTQSCAAGVIQKFYDGSDRLVEAIEPTNDQTYNSGSATGVVPDVTPWLTRYIYDLTQGGTVSMQGGPTFSAYGNLFKTQRYIPGGFVTLNAVTFAAENASGGALPAAAWTDVGGTAFDALDRKISSYQYSSNGIATHSYSYDTNASYYGLLASEQTPVGDTKTYQYDADNQTSSISFTLGSNSDSTYTAGRQYIYDPDGDVAQVGNPQFGNYVYGYDANRELISVAEPMGGSGIPGAAVANSGTLSAQSTYTYAYYGDGLASSLGVSGGATFSESYDYRADGLQSNATYSSTGGSITRSYSNAGRLLTRQDPSGIDSYSYDSDGRLSTAAVPSSSSSSYQYDLEGEPLQFTRSIPGASSPQTVQMQYTASGELDFDSNDVEGESLIYLDGAPIVPGNAMTYNGLTYWNAGSIDPVNLRVTGQVLENANGSIYETAQGTTFDASGRLTQRENWTTPNALLKSFHLWPAAVYTYDAEDHLTYQISSGATGSFSNDEYLYWGPAGHPLTGGSGSTPTYRAYHWSGNGLLFTSLSSGSVNDYKLGIDGDYLAADALQSGAVYFDRDQRGRAVQSHWSSGYSPVCQAAGEYWQSNVACPYLLSGNSGSGQMPEFYTSGFGPIMTYYRQDGVTDSYLGLQGARDYDPAVGQWTTPDAYAGDIFDPMSQAKYMWNNNNPIAYSDPSGYVVICADSANVGGKSSSCPSSTNAEAQAQKVEAQRESLMMDIVLMTLPIPGWGAAEEAAEGGEGEAVYRYGSQQEVTATEESGLVRGGRSGESFVTMDKYDSASEAQAKLALPGTPQVRMRLIVPKGAFSSSSSVTAKFYQPGGGTQRSTFNLTQAIINEVFNLKP